MLRLLIDENFNHHILRGLRSRLPQLDFVVVRAIGLAGSADSELLRWAAQNHRVMVSHDISTMPDCAYELLQQGEPMAGLIMVPQEMRVGLAIRDLELLIACSWESEFRDCVQYLPLK